MQLSGEMSVPQRIVNDLMLAVGGYGITTGGGGGSDNALTNWAGTKRKNGLSV